MMSTQNRICLTVEFTWENPLSSQTRLSTHPGWVVRTDSGITLH